MLTLDWVCLKQSSFLVGCSKLDVPLTPVKMPKQILKSLVSKGVSMEATSGRELRSGSDVRYRLTVWTFRRTDVFT